MEDNRVHCVVEVVGALVVQQEGHRYTGFVGEVTGYVDSVEQQTGAEVDLAGVSSGVCDE